MLVRSRLCRGPWGTALDWTGRANGATTVRVVRGTKSPARENAKVVLARGERQDDHGVLCSVVAAKAWSASRVRAPGMRAVWSESRGATPDRVCRPHLLARGSSYIRSEFAGVRERQRA